MCVWILNDETGEAFAIVALLAGPFLLGVWLRVRNPEESLLQASSILVVVMLVALLLLLIAYWLMYRLHHLEEPQLLGLMTFAVIGVLFGLVGTTVGGVIATRPSPWRLLTAGSIALVTSVVTALFKDAIKMTVIDLMSYLTWRLGLR
jgi:hypothetical protein